jgi:hypothetical protein
VLTVALGSIGPLVYLILRSGDPTASAESLTPRVARN